MMEDKIIMTKTKFKAKGMHCTSCETLIEKSLKKIDGVRNVKADYPSETVSLEFDESKVKIKDVVRAVESKGYTFRKIGPKEGDKGGISNSTLGIIFGILGVLVILYFAFRFYDSVSIPEISQNMGYGLLFLVGLLTGFHCISMCGGFVIGYTTKDAEKGIHPLRSHFMYGLGKTASYTIIGAAFGLLGSIIAFTPLMRGVAG
ncbi:MAG: sulfite exporter TauE/SafE family protein, partial [Nanoarchaeota archaeon]|nr:sulfite exporter TauE/SafE family protein [Nanoarchaeota archaeon]